MNRRLFLASVLSTPLAARGALAAAPRMTVAKSPTCGCCSAWVEHVRAAGFDVDARNVSQTTLDALKVQVGVPAELTSCHTAQIEGYFIEGHVPAEDIHRLLAERPDALGLTVPGMPIGSPGMEMGNEREPYDTILVMRDGTARVFQQHR